MDVDQEIRERLKTINTLKVADQTVARLDMTLKEAINLLIRAEYLLRRTHVNMECHDWRQLENKRSGAVSDIDKFLAINWDKAPLAPAPQEEA